MVDVGDVTLFNEQHPGFLGQTALRGVVYVPLGPSAEKVLPSTIGAILVTESEARAALDFGVLRLMGTLGLRHRWFPTAMWNDRTRSELAVTSVDPPNSLLSRLPRGLYPGVTIELRSTARGPTAGAPVTGHASGDQHATADNRMVAISLPIAAANSIRDGLSQLEASAPFALIGRPDPTAQASFAWAPGPERQQQMDVIGFLGHDGSRMSAAFVALSPATDGPTNVTLLEDGIGVVLAAPDWQRLQDALRSAQDLTVASAGAAASVQVAWRQQPSKTQVPAR